MSEDNKEFLEQEGKEASVEGFEEEKKGFPLWGKILVLCLALAIIVSSVFIFRACDAPPEYSEIEGRLKELLESSKEVNVVLFGEGLPTYERVSDPMDSLNYQAMGDFYTVGDKQLERRVAFYDTIPQKEGQRVVAYKNSHEYKEDYAYAYVANRQMSEAELAALFPMIEGVSAKEGSSFYSEVYRGNDGREICYLVPYVETKYDFYYTAADDENYDYVHRDAPCQSVKEIEELARTVYCEKYVESLSSTLFDGVASGDMVMTARYIEYSTGLAQLNSYEPLFREHRVYDLTEAEIVKWGSDKENVIIKVKSYLPSAPEKISEDEITITFENGNWYLVNPVF